MTTIHVTGTGAFGAAVAKALDAAGHKVTGVTAPVENRRGTGPDLLRLWAELAHLPADDRITPDHVDAELLLSAHSHAFVGRRTRAAAQYALGYHPSLLPLHRGRDAVKWQHRLGERVVGGSVYHLTDRIDGGPLHDRRHLVITPCRSASELWHDHLFPLGVDMLVAAADAVQDGRVAYSPQDDTAATWEPSFESEPLYRPELLEIERGDR